MVQKIPNVTTGNAKEWATDWGEEALEKCKQWLVLEAMCYVVPKADPKQTAKDKVGVYAAGDIVPGDGTVVNGIQWLQVRHEGKDAFILIDGKAVGAKRKFLEPVPG
uniref:Uncharacterized protein n=1 Tax=Alexandrium andersonii TaxID=327968 RepID=A0A7S2N0K2_9DINO|mmetsp:Transcript_80449/g.180004  ORF Transcript_80449/g.180004 Transcript_80449/m.180004 type:complete len:107 (+) Transcript_80449:106-426(+)